jgi:hypothetical protein
MCATVVYSVEDLRRIPVFETFGTRSGDHQNEDNTRDHYSIEPFVHFRCAGKSIQAEALRLPESEAVNRRAAGETLAAIAKSYGVDVSMILRL